VPRTIFRGLLRCCLAVLTILLTTGLAANRAQAADVLIFAAASTAPALDAVIAAFDPGTQVIASYAASSALARQIEHGAPADLYLSANSAWMDYLDDRGLIQNGTRCDLLGNELVLIAPADSSLSIDRFSNVTDLPALLAGGRLALGDPDHVPAGIYARQALQSLGLWQGVADHLAPVADVRGALALVARGETPLGIVYASDAKGRGDVGIVASIPPSSHAPIRYAVALVGEGDNLHAQAFLTYLSGPAARAIFRARGFGVMACSP